MHAFEQHDIFRHLSKDEVEFLVRCFEIVVIPKGQFLFKQDVRGPGMMIIKEGVCEISVNLPSGFAIEKGVLGSQALLGELHLVSDRSGATNILSKTSLEVYFLSREVYRAIRQLRPRVFLTLTRNIATLSAQRAIEILKKTRLSKGDCQLPPLKALAKTDQEPHLDHYSFRAISEKIFHSSHPGLLLEPEFSDFFEVAHVVFTTHNTLIPTTNGQHSICYFVVQGVIQQITQKEGKKFKIRAIRPGNFFNARSILLQDTPQDAEYFTRSNTLLLAINANKLNDLQHINEACWYKISIELYQEAILHLRVINEYINQSQLLFYDAGA